MLPKLCAEHCVRHNGTGVSEKYKRSLFVLVCSGLHNRIPPARWLQQQKFIFPKVLEVWKTKVLADLVSPEASLLVLQRAAFLSCSHTAFFSILFILSVSLCVLISSTYKDTDWMRAQPNSLILTLLPLPPSKYSPILKV